MALKLKEKFGMTPFMADLMEEDVVVVLKLSMLTSSIRKQVWDILDEFLSFLTKCEEKKAHNMLSLMLDARFKSLRLVFSFINQEQVVSMVENYDKQMFVTMVFEMIVETNELTKESMNKKLQMCWRYH